MRRLHLVVSKPMIPNSSRSKPRLRRPSDLLRSSTGGIVGAWSVVCVEPVLAAGVALGVECAGTGVFVAEPLTLPTLGVPRPVCSVALEVGFVV